MFSHVMAGTNDLDKARSFYDAVLAPLGLVRRWNFPTASGYQQPGSERHPTQFWITRPFDGRAASAGNGIMPGFLAPDRAAVDAFYAAAIKLGGTDEGPPGVRPHYHPHYYGAYVRDPDGNKLCACCHRAYPGDR